MFDLFNFVQLHVKADSFYDSIAASEGKIIFLHVNWKRLKTDGILKWIVDCICGIVT